VSWNFPGSRESADPAERGRIDSPAAAPVKRLKALINLR